MGGTADGVDEKVGVVDEVVAGVNAVLPVPNPVNAGCGCCVWADAGEADISGDLIAPPVSVLSAEAGGFTPNPFAPWPKPPKLKDAFCFGCC